MKSNLLELHDSIPFFDKSNTTYKSQEKERDEQLMVYKYIDENDTVLELGCRYGTVSCLTSRLCKKLIAVDPDKEAIEVCKKNMKVHGVNFECLWGIISKESQILNTDLNDDYSYFTQYSYKDDKSDDKEKIPNFLINEVEDMFSVEFNTIIADCEGCLEQVIKENDISKIKKIIYETDRKDNCNYDYISRHLIDLGFKQHEVVTRDDKLENICWIKINEEK